MKTASEPMNREFPTPTSPQDDSPLLKESETFICNECTKTFSKRSKLNRHWREQHEEPYLKKFDCSECPLSFKRKEHLTRHLKAKHIGEKFQCDFCVARFVEKYKLRNHLRTTHTQYMCNKCNKIDAAELELDHHCKDVPKQDPKESYQCGYCPKIYKRTSYLEKHVNESHGYNPEDPEASLRAKLMFEAGLTDEHSGQA